jgi:hypothetical protein
MNLMINESWVNATKGWRLGESGVYETYTDKVFDLFRSMQKEYGRCISKMYVDEKNGNVRHIGWVFQKRKQYEDCKETYVQETWISVHEKPNKTTTTYYYKPLTK